jgi:hypothetical protein
MVAWVGSAAPAIIAESLAETAMYRYKTVVGRRLHARTLTNQQTEVKIRCKVLNQMTTLGMPVTVRIR